MDPPLGTRHVMSPLWFDYAHHRSRSAEQFGTETSASLSRAAHCRRAHAEVVEASGSRRGFGARTITMIEISDVYKEAEASGSLPI